MTGALKKFQSLHMGLGGTFNLAAKHVINPYSSLSISAYVSHSGMEPRDSFLCRDCRTVDWCVDVRLFCRVDLASRHTCVHTQTARLRARKLSRAWNSDSFYCRKIGDLCSVRFGPCCKGEDFFTRHPSESSRKESAYIYCTIFVSRLVVRSQKVGIDCTCVFSLARSTLSRSGNEMGFPGLDQQHDTRTH